MPYSTTYNYVDREIVITPTPVEATTPVNITVPELFASIREAEASEQGIIYPAIANASGRNQLSPGTETALTLELLGWQMKFLGTGYLAQISGGNLIGGDNGDPFADHPGISVLNILSQAGTVVTVSGGGSIPEQDKLDIADRVWRYTR